jgi:EmrB/QacA subfamily drug resistance transporter
MLVAARALQGVGGALLSPAALSLLITIFPEGKERNRALGVWSALAAGGGAVGLLLGGVLTDLATWRWVFLVNVPVGIIVLIASFRVLPASKATARGRIDVAGAVTVTAGLIALVYGLSRGGQKGFGEGLVVALLAASILLLAAFVVIELRSREPLVPFGLFRLHTLTGANLATLLLSAVILGVNYFLTLYFQQVLGYSPLVTGMAFLPMTLASVLASAIAARLVGQMSIRLLLLLGMLALAGGAALLSQIVPHGTYLVSVLPGLLLVAIGLGFGFTIGTLAATAGVTASQQGVASGILSTSQQLGGAIGLAILTVVASTATTSATGSTSQVLTDGFRAAFLVACGFALVAALLVGLLVRASGRQPEHQTQIPAGLLGSGNAQTSACQPAVVQLAVAQNRTKRMAAKGQ